MYITKELKRNATIIFLCFFMVKTGFSQVKMWEEQVVIPTLKVGTPAPHPTFKREIDMLADDDQIYPYLYNSVITTKYEDKSYKGCYLENKYVKVLITPELGGKLYGARDKTNQYNFIYWQPTVKPALISLTGPWVSGGIEWCFPSGHRQTTYQEIEHRLVENKDGSKTVWVGETEWVHGLRWIVGVTVYPGKSVVEAKIRMSNPTQMPQSQYMWAIAATHANADYQLIYRTNYMAGHNKFEYTPWPIKADGTDISWWKNIPNANSYFANDMAGFFGGYDHKKNAGTVFTGNKHTMIGKKFWTWGTSPFGRMWDWVLSDGGGPYAEPQAGIYSDNQPDFHWMQPSDFRTFNLYFYPVKDIGNYKEANENGALNLEFNNNSVQIGAYSTAMVHNATVRLLYKGKVVFEQNTDVDPAKPFVATAKEYHKDFYNYTLELLDSNEKKILSYSPELLETPEKPKEARAYEDPTLFKSNDEVWNIGDFLHKNRDKNKAEIFFKEILKKDSLDTRANLSMAHIEIDRANYKKALAHLEKAHQRAWDEGQLFYLKGVAYESMGNLDEAYNAYYRAALLQGYYARSYERIAKIDLVNNNSSKALGHIQRALNYNAQSPQLLVLQSLAYRLNNQYDLSMASVNEALDIDPINFWGHYEKNLVLKQLGKTDKKEEGLQNALMLGKSHYYIELSTNYIEAGQYADAVTVLSQATTNKLDNTALIYYYMGFCQDKLGDKKAAEQSFALGRRKLIENVYPFRRKSIEVMHTALKYDANDDKAYYYLGLIYTGLNNGSKAYKYFLKASRLNPKNGNTWRNLGFLKGGYNGITADLKLAKTYYEKAFKLMPKDDLVLMELDNVKADLNEDLKERLKFLKKNIKVVEKRDDLLSSMLDLMVAFGEYDTPISYYKNHVFNNREGKYTIHNSYMNALIGKANKAKTPQEALAYYEKATLYPDNLKVKPRVPNFRGFLYYPMALIYEKIGDNVKATEYINITKMEHTKLPTLVNYYQALAIQKINGLNDKEAFKLIFELKNEASKLINGKVNGYFRREPNFRKALGYYYLSVLSKDKGEVKESLQQLNKAKKLYPFIERDAIIWAQITFAGASQ